VLIGLFLWWLVSQLVAWMISGNKNEDDVVETWFVIFMLPVIVPIAILTVWGLRLRGTALRYGIPEFILDWFD